MTGRLTTPPPLIMGQRQSIRRQGKAVVFFERNLKSPYRKSLDRNLVDGLLGFITFARRVPLWYLPAGTDCISGAA